MVLVIDNYDSFTYNLVQYLGEMKVELEVYRNDQITIERIRELKPERIASDEMEAEEFSSPLPVESLSRIEKNWFDCIRSGATQGQCISIGI